MGYPLWHVLILVDAGRGCRWEYGGHAEIAHCYIAQQLPILYISECLQIKFNVFEQDEWIWIIAYCLSVIPTVTRQPSFVSFLCYKTANICLIFRLQVYCYFFIFLFFIGKIWLPAMCVPALTLKLFLINI